MKSRLLSLSMLSVVSLNITQKVWIEAKSVLMNVAAALNMELESYHKEV